MNTDTSTPTKNESTERERIKAEFIAQRGYWRPWVDTLLQACPTFVEQYARYAGYPARTGPLSERLVELIYVALDSSSSHLYAPGLQTHMKHALEVGATEADIMDVLHLVAVQGAACVCQAADIVAECAGWSASADGMPGPMRRIGAEHAISLEAMQSMDPGYAQVLADFIETGRPAGGLSPAESTLIQLALHSCFTAFNAQAVRAMVTAGLGQGLAVPELMQAIQLGAHLAAHGSAMGASVLGELRGAR